MGSGRIEPDLQSRERWRCGVSGRLTVILNWATTKQPPVHER